MTASNQVDLVILSNFIHQVVNPLNGVAGSLDNLILGNVEGADRQEQRLRAARAQLEHTITLIRNLAYLSAGFEVGQGDRQTIVAPQVIIEAAQFFQELAAQKRMKIWLDNRSDQNKATGHTDLFRQVLMNLFDNAVKYSEDGSQVDVHQWVQRHSSDLIVDVVSTPKYGAINIDLSRISEQGYRGENAKAIVASGTGIGLYICKNIIEVSHCGKFEIERVNGNRLRFRCRIPGGWRD